MAIATAFQASAPVAFAKGKLGLYLAWAAFSKRNGEDFYDSHGDHIPEDDLVAGALSLAKSRLLKVEHNGADRGDIPLVYPMTTDIAKSLGLESKDSGLLIGFRPDAELAAQIDAGEIDQLSISGRAMAEMVKAEIEKSAGAATAPRKRKLTEVEIDEVSLVKRAAHGTGTRIAIAKRADAAAETAESALLTLITANRDAIAKALTRTTETENTMDELKKAQADLAVAQTAIAKSDARCAVLKSVLFASLSAPADQRAYAARLGEDAAEAFFAKSDSERSAEVKDAVAHVSKSGEVFYKTDDARLVAMAKRDDEREVEFAKANGERDMVAFEKRAAVELPNMNARSRGLFIKAIGDNTEALADLKQADAAIAFVTKAHGVGGGKSPDRGPELELETIAKSLQAANPSLTAEMANAAALATERGAQLYAQLQPARV